MRKWFVPLLVVGLAFLAGHLTTAVRNEKVQAYQPSLSQPLSQPTAVQMVVWQGNDPKCPFCLTEVARDTRATACPHCTRVFVWQPTRCAECEGTGKVACNSANAARAKEVYQAAFGTGYYGESGFRTCRGRGQYYGVFADYKNGGLVEKPVGTCTNCGGQGQITCPACKGSGQYLP